MIPDPSMFEIVGDNREGWLTLWKQVPGGAAERVREAEMPRAGQTEALDVLSSWPEALPAGHGTHGSEV